MNQRNKLITTALVCFVALIFFTGWLFLNRPRTSSNTTNNDNQNSSQANVNSYLSILDDLGEPHLDQATASTIQKNILAWDQYQTTSEFGALPDCGESENSRLYASINKDRKFQTLNNAFTLFITPNPKNWNLKQAQEFIQDSTITCGVGAPAPIFTDTVHILWAFRCLGGVMPDKRSPNYSKEISCLQTSEVVANYFGIESME